MKTSLNLSVSMDFDSGSRTWPLAPSSVERGSGRPAYERALESVRLAEEFGFDWISCSEHHYSPRSMTPSPIVFAAWLAQATTRIKIALLGPVVPLSNPVRLAEEVAILDNLCNGRTICLFLRGTPNEWLTYRTNQDETREMTQEGIELILRAWTEPEPFAWEGRYFKFRNVAVWPRLMQNPYPKMYGSGNSQESVAFVARQRMGLAASFIPHPVLKRAIDLHRDESVKAGWTPGPDDVVYRCFAHVANTQEKAERDVKEDASVFTNLFRLNKAIEAAVTGSQPIGAGYPTRPALFGSPDAFVEQLGKLREIGVGVIDLSLNWPGVTYEQRIRALECYATKVLPQIRDL